MFRIRVLLSASILRVVRGFDVKISEEWSMVYGLQNKCSHSGVALCYNYSSVLCIMTRNKKIKSVAKR